MNMAVNTLYASLPQDSIAERTKEDNKTNQFYYMKNKHGRTVPVPTDLLQNCYMRGFTHTDNVVYSDDPRLESKVENNKSDKAIFAEAMTAMTKALTPKETVGLSASDDISSWESMKEYTANKGGFVYLNKEEKEKYQTLKAKFAN
jgi:hypothetical protein